MIVLARVINVGRITDTQVRATIEYTGPWGTANDVITADLATVTPVQAIAAIKQRAVDFALQPAVGGNVILPRDVWVFGGPQ